MSSSTVRKTRQTDIASGTDKKTLAAKKEEAKKKKEKTKWYIVTAIIVLFFAFVIYLNTGGFYRNLTGMTVSFDASKELGIEAGSRSFTVAECNYVYNTQYINTLNSLGDYASMLIDTNTPLDEQTCTMVETDEENYTWDDYFTDQTEDFLKELAVLEAYAKANDVVLDKEDMEVVDEGISQFDAATEYGYASVGKFIAANYGKGCNEAVLRSMMELQQLGTKAQQGIADSFEFTSKEIAAKYETVKDSYDAFTYSYYLVAAETETDEEGNAEAPTDEALAKAEETAKSVKDKMDKEDLSLSKAAKAVVKDAEITEQTDVAGGNVEAELNEWLVDAERAKGDCTVIKGTSGAYVVVFGSRDNNQHPTDDSGDMNYCDFVGDNLLRSEALEKWHVEKLGPVEETMTVDAAFGMKYVGR